VLDLQSDDNRWLISVPRVRPGWGRRNPRSNSRAFCGIHKTLGARPLQQVIRKHLGDAVRQVLKAGRAPFGVLGLAESNDSLEILV